MMHVRFCRVSIQHAWTRTVELVMACSLRYMRVVLDAKQQTEKPFACACGAMLHWINVRTTRETRDLRSPAFDGKCQGGIIVVYC